jgi:hypothetical protein
MSRARWLCGASLLAAVVAVACEPDTIDLLPPGVGGSTSERGGSGGAAGTEATSGGGNAGMSGVSGAGAVSGSGGSASGGSGGNDSGPGGGGMGGGGCSGLGCGGFPFDNGFGGEPSDCDNFELFCLCGPQGRCATDLKCNERLDRCTPKCDSPFECGTEWLICEDHSCASCSDDEQCEMWGSFERTVCVEGRCEECANSMDCLPDSPMCVGRRCLQCLTDEDCPGRVCNKARGRCEK